MLFGITIATLVLISVSFFQYHGFLQFNQGNRLEKLRYKRKLILKSNALQQDYRKVPFANGSITP
jgi:hypothetical protein